MLARLLAFVPAKVTGRIEARARREVHSWIQDNATFRSYRYGWFRRLLMWGTDHPVLFTVLVLLLAGAMAYALAVQDLTGSWRLPAPMLKEDFDVATYTGVPWSVQSTLVALVYPIVLAFIALMLQRKANSTVSLRVYVLDSGVIPAGASSVGLLVTIGAQYFASPYASSPILATLMAPLLVLNGTWLLMNVLLTGFFLSRTVRFIQEEEQRYVFTRVAIDIALRGELVSAVTQHIFVNAPTTDWGFPGRRVENERGPRVRTLSFTEASPQVTRSLKANAVLHDVHLHLLCLVVILWKRRAFALANARDSHPPTLIFPAIVGSEGSGVCVLCSVDNGPSLNRFERLLVRAAFIYRPARGVALSLSTRTMLEEIGGEVEAAAEQHRFGAAEQRLVDVLRLHRALLLAGSVDEEGIVGNAATIGMSPYGWGDSSFDQEWLKPYRDVGRIAINRLEDDSRLFRALAVVPASIAAQLPSRPEKLLINAQLVGMDLVYQLAGWWTRKADESLVPGATTFSGTLPAPLNKVYERAIVDFIGSWGRFRVDIPPEFRNGEFAAWQAFTGRALVYASHIEHSAHLFLDAVSRGDTTGSSWLLENFLKWWGNRHYELECDDIEHDCRVRHVTLTLADKDWDSARVFLWDGVEPVRLEFAKKALSLAVRRYWESIRLYVVLLLIQNAGDAPAADCLEIRYAAQLVAGTSQRSGGNVDARPLDTVDNLLARLIGILFGVETPVARINAFAERLGRGSQVPEVSGWIYSWSVTPKDLVSMNRALVILVAALQSSTKPDVERSKRLIERWWRDVDKLERTHFYLGELRREVLSGAVASAAGAIEALQALLQKKHRPRAGRLGAALALKKLRAVASHERRITLNASTVDLAKVQDFAIRVASQAFLGGGLPAPINEIVFTARDDFLLQYISFSDYRKRYLANLDVVSGTGTSEHIAKEMQGLLIATSLRKLISDSGAKAVNKPEIRTRYDAAPSEMQAYVSAVAQECAALEAKGLRPVILVGRSGTRTLLGPHKWGVNEWECLPPVGTVISRGVDSHPMAISTINDIPVFQLPTPNQDCYVLSADRIKTLFVCGSGVVNALDIAWKDYGDDQLEFTINWRAGFA